MGIIKQCISDVDTDADAYDDMYAVWEIDSAIMFNGEALSPPLDKTDYPDDFYDVQVIRTCDSFQYFVLQSQIAGYNAQVDSFHVHEVEHDSGRDVPYTQVWNDSEARADANNALQGWRSVCSPPVEQTGVVSCCLHVIMDTVVATFDAISAGPSAVYAATVYNGQTDGFPRCDDASLPCPYYARFIELNVTNDMLQQTLRPHVPNTLYARYILHPLSFFTSPTTAPVGYEGFTSMSFLTLMRHEIGHFLGLEHPDQKINDTTSCTNCYTSNPAWTTDTNGVSTFHPNGYQTVMMPIWPPTQYLCHFLARMNVSSRSFIAIHASA